LLAISGLPAHIVSGQTSGQENITEQVQKLTDAIARTQSQLDESQRELNAMRQQLVALRGQLTQSGPNTAPPAPTGPPPASASLSSASATEAIDDLHDRQTFNESQIATLNQDKVESESKYPVKITGLLLLNGFVNSGSVDVAATPTVAVPGRGSTGLSIRQTMLGFDAQGPHLLGASSYAGLRIDFDGYPQSSSTGSSYYATENLLRLRTAYAALQWSKTEAYFSYDRPIFSPDTPTSLTAVAEPALAWSGNLWTWNPQVGVKQDLHLARSHDLRIEAAVMDVADAPLTPLINAGAPSTPILANGAEQSRWPGAEARVALLGSGSNEESNHIGVGGYFAPRHNVLGYSFDSWAATLDTRFHLPAHLQLTGSFYRGLGLGGLGGGAYKDFVYRPYTVGEGYYFRSLDDAGGWAQLKEKFSQRLELNAAFGMDNVFASEMRRYASTVLNPYLNLARNRTYTGNVIFSPSAYLLFSLEYRHIESSPVVGLPAGSNVIGVGAGYKF
jgi:uncharacterized coiled-coil protein SlyX